MTDSVLSLRHARLAYGRRVLWSGLDLDVSPGEFVAALGANGSGKTSLLRAILGLQPLTDGAITICGRPARQANRLVGYVQQQRRIDPLTPLRTRDVVRQGLDGSQFGFRFGLHGRAARGTVDAALRSVGVAALADRPIGQLSGGEQQRVRMAQALVSDPALLLCDEPLLSLDPGSQRTITALVDQRRRRHDTAVLFVTHEINPVLPYVDRVLYLAGGTFRVGAVDDVLTSETLSELYDVPIQVVRAGGRILVAGIPEHLDSADAHHPQEELVP